MIEPVIKLIDLTQALHPSIPDWHGCCGFQLHQDIDYKDVGIRTQSITTPLGIGTHIDAPSHFFEGACDIATIALETLYVESVVINVAHKITPDYVITVQDIKDFEMQYKSIKPHMLILAHTGWSQYWHNPEKYRNADSNGYMHFPRFSEEAADYLLTKFCVGIGIDTLSPDGSNMNFSVHKKILGAGKYIVENLCCLDKLNPYGHRVIVLPLKIK